LAPSVRAEWARSIALMILVSVATSLLYVLLQSIAADVWITDV
jgi:hypothetical protein